MSMPVKIAGRILAASFLLASTASAQTASMGPLYINGHNPQGYPIFMLRCFRGQCVGLQGKKMGSSRDVAQYMPEISAQDIQRYSYDCWILCRDFAGNIIGRPSPNYRNPYAPLDRGR